MLKFKPDSFASYLAIVSLGLLLSCAFTREASAQERGAAFFALNAPKFPCDDALRAFEPGSKISSLAILWGTFGNELTCLNRWAAQMKSRDLPHVLQIHLSNETCRRATNRKCSAAELWPAMSVREYNRALESRQRDILASLRERINTIEQVVAAFDSPKLEIVLSTGLEDNYSLEAYRVMLEVVRAEWPYKIVRNPVGALKDLSRLGADYIEIHGARPKFAKGEPCIANLDGEDIVFPHRRSPTTTRVSWDNVVKYINNYEKRCRVTFFWSAPWQGLFSDRFPLAEERRFEVSAADIDAIRNVK